LSDPAELSGVLNRALDAMGTLDATGFTETPSMVAAWQDFRQATDPVAVWLDRATTAGAGLTCTKSALHGTYNTAAAKDGRPTMTANAFGRALRRHRPQVQEAQRVVNGKTVWVWDGIGLASTGAPPWP
jgi:hypothetical protein